MDRELETFDMKRYVKMNYDVAAYVNKHIIQNVRYRGSNRPIKEKQPILCPFHDESVASFYYYSKTNRFYCFGCGGKGGDVIDLHMLWSARLGRKISFKQAVVELNSELQTRGR